MQFQSITYFIGLNNWVPFTEEEKFGGGDVNQEH